MKKGSIIKIRSHAWPELDNIMGIVLDADESFACVYFAQINRKISFGTGIFQYIEVIHESR
tara:strand:+ start:1245 stop:1427 length:183 start_codon:yes stop_codon:yes gene_type:complete